VHKATSRDLPWLMARGETGATTVASTMRLAHMAGIRVFATGGAGGVHRGATHSMDISADLTELARTPVAVVSAGFKSILDIALTLEHLETLGVPVVVNGSDDFPSFYSRTSGLPSPRRLDGPVELAAMLHATWHHLGLTCGVSIANPIPAADEIPAAEIEAAITAAIADMQRQGISGRDVSPFLLAAIVERTGGASLTANVALVRNNAALAAQLAAEYAKLLR
jgi:pseudouridine-5'-phosphate glycosidase